MINRLWSWFKQLRRWKRVLLTIAFLISSILVLPQSFTMPVKGATQKDYNPKSYWFYPWGKSGCHKGVDIFAKKGTEVVASVRGIVFRTGENERGGKFVIILGPKLRFHYYAHLNEIKAKKGEWTSLGETIGTVGDSGNAKGKPAHLHYSIVAWLPHFWRIDGSHQGWKKMFYLDPIKYIEDSMK